jgi:hypothetical protein
MGGWVVAEGERRATGTCKHAAHASAVPHAMQAHSVRLHSDTAVSVRPEHHKEHKGSQHLHGRLRRNTYRVHYIHGWVGEWAGSSGAAELASLLSPPPPLPPLSPGRADDSDCQSAAVDVQRPQRLSVSRPQGPSDPRHLAFHGCDGAGCVAVQARARPHRSPVQCVHERDRPVLQGDRSAATADFRPPPLSIGLIDCSAGRSRSWIAQGYQPNRQR